jgi:hypothetical protein
VEGKRAGGHTAAPSPSASAFPSAAAAFHLSVDDVVQRVRAGHGVKGRDTRSVPCAVGRDTLLLFLLSRPRSSDSDRGSSRGVTCAPPPSSDPLPRPTDVAAAAGGCCCCVPGITLPQQLHPTPHQGSACRVEGGHTRRGSRGMPWQRGGGEGEGAGSCYSSSSCDAALLLVSPSTEHPGYPTTGHAPSSLPDSRSAGVGSTQRPLGMAAVVSASSELTPRKPVQRTAPQ